MRLPDIAAELRDLAVIHGLPRLKFLADEIGRRKPKKRAKATSVSMSPQLKADIRQCARDFPHWQQREIAEHFNINPGRVSETLNGKRK